MVVELDNKLKFIANFKYEIKKNVTTKPMEMSVATLDKLIPDTEDAAKRQFDSICDETMIGFVQDQGKVGSITNHEVICFFAEKDKKHLYED